jgi:hypothetical protein
MMNPHRDGSCINHLVLIGDNDREDCPNVSRWILGADACTGISTSGGLQLA